MVNILIAHALPRQIRSTTVAMSEQSAIGPDRKPAMHQGATLKDWGGGNRETAAGNVIGKY
jgi:hypothetical protein